MTSPHVVDYRGSFDVEHSVAETWARLIEVESFARTWRWIRELEVYPSPLEAGTLLRFVATPPIPYRLAVEVEIEELKHERYLHASVRRDLEGHGTIELEPRGTGACVTLSWEVEMKQRAMRLVARAARPLLLMGHDWAVRAALDSFRRELDRPFDDEA